MFGSSKHWIPIIVLIGTALSGCAAKQPLKARLVIPKRCINENLTSFQKPCQALSDSVALCNQVQIHYSCLQVTK